MLVVSLTRSVSVSYMCRGTELNPTLLLLWKGARGLDGVESERFSRRGREDNRRATALVKMSIKETSRNIVHRVFYVISPNADRQISMPSSLIFSFPLNSINYTTFWLSMSIFQTLLFSKNVDTSMQTLEYLLEEIPKKLVASPTHSVSVLDMFRATVLNTAFLRLLKTTSGFKGADSDGFPGQDRQGNRRAPPLVKRGTNCTPLH